MQSVTDRAGVKLKRLVVDRLLEPSMPLSRVESQMVFWARLVVRIRRPFIIGVTGSVGKSTTTAMIAAVLAQPLARRRIGLVGCTRDNMNDDFGVSATLLRFMRFVGLPWAYSSRLALWCVIPLRALCALAARYPKVMVLEFGVGSTANLHRLVTVAPPNVSVVTRIGAAHLEVVRTLDGIVLEKSALVRAVDPSGLVVLGDDHDHVAELERVAAAPVIKVSGKGLDLSRNITRVVCAHLGIPDDVVETGLRDFKPPPRRLHKLEFDGLTVIDDTYNANPLSMRLGLDTLAETALPGQRRLAILGFMSELGEESIRYHREVAGHARSRADVVVGVGDLARSYDADAWFATSDACAQGIAALVRPGDCVLVKGSASARMEAVVKVLADIAGKSHGMSLRAGAEGRSLQPVQ